MRGYARRISKLASPRPSRLGDAEPGNPSPVPSLQALLEQAYVYILGGSKERFTEI